MLLIESRPIGNRHRFWHVVALPFAFFLLFTWCLRPTQILVLGLCSRLSGLQGVHGSSGMKWNSVWSAVAAAVTVTSSIRFGLGPSGQDNVRSKPNHTPLKQNTGYTLVNSSMTDITNRADRGRNKCAAREV